MKRLAALALFVAAGSAAAQVPHDPFHVGDPFHQSDPFRPIDPTVRPPAANPPLPGVGGAIETRNPLLQPRPLPGLGSSGTPQPLSIPAAP